MNRTARSISIAIAALAFALPVSAQQRTPASTGARPAVPTPGEVLGFEPGTAQRLASWEQIVSYFKRLDAASARVTVREIGRTTLGAPMIAVFIADERTIRDMSRVRETQRLLADPRLLPDSAARARLIASGRVVIMATSSIHSTEVGATLSPMRIAHRLATSEAADARRIRASALTILVPSLNPDGVNIVKRWYDASIGTAWEGGELPVLYHHYVGHDNNRDWYAFTQRETRLIVDSLHNVWHPQVVTDIHQQGEYGSRIMIPPYLDPIEPNVDPLLTAGVNALGTAMAWRLTAQGKTGISINATYDAWTPARAYQHYHGGVRILTETASASMATSVDVPRDSLRAGRGFDARTPSWNFVQPWTGGTWTLANIVDYQASATWALLDAVSEGREQWLSTFSRVSERAVQGRRSYQGGAPAGYVISTEGADPAAVRTLLNILRRAQVEVSRTTSRSRTITDGASKQVEVAAGSLVVPLAQPYGAFAKALLERQVYPDLREYPNGPPRRPYDVTAHTLPLLLGVRVNAFEQDSMPASTIEREAIDTTAMPAVPGLTGGTRRIAIYRSFDPSMDEGWTRWVFDQYRIPFTTVTDRDVRAGKLRERFDVVLLPDQSSRQLSDGNSGPYPDSLKGGLGTSGATALRDFVRAGGTLVAFNSASRYAIRALALPVRDLLDSVAPREFYGPGSLLAVEPGDGGAAMLNGWNPPERAVWFEQGPAFQVIDTSRARTLLRYPRESAMILLSGWLLGAERLAGASALVEVREGNGRVVLFGFRPQYRGQSMATYPLLWNALR